IPTATRPSGRPTTLYIAPAGPSTVALAHVLPSAVHHAAVRPAPSGVCSLPTTTAPPRPLADAAMSVGRSVPDDLIASISLCLVHARPSAVDRSEEHTSELQSRQYLVCRF